MDDTGGTEEPNKEVRVAVHGSGRQLAGHEERSDDWHAAREERIVCRGKLPQRVPWPIGGGIRFQDGCCREEADETALWIELVMESGMLPRKKLEPLWQEADELTRIAVASIRTTRRSPSIRNPKSAIRNRTSAKTERTDNAK
jgi:hypothetical protein